MNLPKGLLTAVRTPSHMMRVGRSVVVPLRWLTLVPLFFRIAREAHHVIRDGVLNVFRRIRNVGQAENASDAGTGLHGWAAHVDVLSEGPASQWCGVATYAHGGVSNGSYPH